MKCDKRQNGLFLFLKEGRDTHMAAVLLKWKIKQKEEIDEQQTYNQHKSAS